MSRPPRAPSFSYRGRYRYFVTFCCRNRECLFADADRAAETLEQFLARYILEEPGTKRVGRSAAADPHVGSDRWTLEQLFDAYSA